MPIHDSKRVEFSFDSGHINIVADSGARIPAYWAHPRVGQRFSGVCLLHDWWGVTPVVRLVANFFAQMGYYVIVPDLFNGSIAHSARQARELVEQTANTRYDAVDAALTVLETHHRTNRSVAALGLGMGGSLAFEAAIRRDDLEAAISLAGFPLDYLGQFAKANTPILAIYGSEEPYTKPATIEQLQQELHNAPLRSQHQVVTIQGAGHEFFSETPNPHMQQIGRQVVDHILAFMEQHITEPEHQNKSARRP